MVDPTDFEIGKQLGAGASASVNIAIFKPNNQEVAIKSVNIYDQAKRKQFKTDLKVLSENDCPFLVKFYGGYFEKGSIKLVLEYMDVGSLDRVINKIKKMKEPFVSEAVLSKITQQV